jgi:ATP-binding cassette subfamily C protein CydD
MTKIKLSMSPTHQFLSQEKKTAGNLISQVVGLGTLSSVLLIAQAWLLALIVHLVVIEKQAITQLMSYLWLILCLFILRSILVYYSQWYAFKAAARIKQSVRERLFQQLQKLGPAYLSQQQSGELNTIINDNVEALEDYYAKYLPAMSLVALLPLSILAFVLPLDWKSALVMMVTAPLIPFFMILIGKGAEKLNQQQWQNLQRMGGHFLDVIQGLTTLKLFNASQREAKVIAKISHDYRLATMRVLRVAFLSSLALEFFATVSIAIVAVLIGFRLLYGQLDFMTGFFVLLLAPEFYLPFRSLGSHYHARMHAIGAAESMAKILTTPSQQKNNRHSETNINDHKSIEINTDAPFQLQFKQLSFSYSGNNRLLNNINFQIAAGEKIALVGKTGAGKSTLIQLILGFRQAQQGAILVNDNPLNSISMTYWHQHIAWVPQHPRVFSASVRDNIAMGLPSTTFSEIKQAAQQANALDFIQQLPQGFSTLVGEGGRDLSGGQIQRLILARAFLRRARLVILDEASAHLDSRTEQRVNQAINRLAKQATLFMVAHRSASIQLADRILVLENGQIIETRQYHEQLENNPFFQTQATR